MRRYRFWMKFLLVLACSLSMGLLCSCKEVSVPEENPIAEEEQTENAVDLENADAKEEPSQGEDALSEEERTIYEAYLQAEYASDEYLYAYCDFDEDGAMELYIRIKDSERNYGYVEKYLQGGLTNVESGDISEKYIEELSWSEVPWEASDTQEEMTHKGVYAYVAQNTENRRFWYPDEETFLAQYGLADEEPFYEYIMEDGTQRLKFYYDEETQSGGGINYYKRDPSDIMTSGACGFTFQGLTEELMYADDGLSVDYSKFETLYGDTFSEEEGYEETIEYDGVSNQVSHYEVSGVVEEGEEPELLLWMDYQYYPNGNLKERFYYHNPRMFGTWYTTWQSYFDTQGRLEHEYIYITHGWLEYYYLYEDEGKTPAYCLMLDNNLGWFIPELYRKTDVTGYKLEVKMEDAKGDNRVIEFYKEDIQDVKNFTNGSITIKSCDIDLNDDGLPDKLVSIISPLHSGSHGDMFQILWDDDGVLKEIYSMTVSLYIQSTDYPFIGNIYILNNRSNGFYDIKIVTDENSFILHYDGDKYIQE